MIPERAQVILDFWFKETSSEMRFKKDDEFDQKIKNNFFLLYLNHRNTCLLTKNIN